jgi:UDP:flavonoid glycosyltransferase YjiC (YdhE family)
MLALPLTLDQPLVAAHLVRLGVAEALSTDNRSVEQIQTALLKIRRDTRYREAAQQLQKELLALQGSDHAAEIIEARLSMSAPASATPSAFDFQLRT